MLISPCVADKFYPGDSTLLRHEIQTMLAHVAATAGHLPPPKAMIVPHAGYIYSGITAAAAYACLSKAHHHIKHIVLLAPLHRYPISGIVTTDASGYVTPFGEIPIDKETLANSSLSVINEAFHTEHALEVQLPFLQVVLKDFTLIPLLIGETTSTHVAQVLTTLWGGQETLVIISSDLSHYYPYHKAQLIDHDTARAILDLKPDVLQTHHACGVVAIQGLLMVAAAQNMTVQQIALCNSGDTAGSRTSVVGYGAFHFN